MTAPSQTQVFLARALLARLTVWPVLRIAVDSSWGGPESKQKRSWMASELLDVFESSSSSSSILNPNSASNQVDEDYIEEMILQMMNDEFDCVIEDGSSAEVAVDLVKLWKEAQSGGEKVIEQNMKFWEEKERSIQGKRIQAQEIKTKDEEEWEGDGGESGDEEDEEDEEDGSEEGGMEVDEPPTLVDIRHKEDPVVDEDGFTLVKGRGKRHG
jgi:pre-rRNA-processing protein TSR2